MREPGPAPRPASQSPAPPKGPNVFLNLLAALLPAQERAELARRQGTEPQRWSLLLGLAEFYLGGRFLFASGLAYFEAQSAAMATYLVEEADPRALGSFESRLAFTQSGTILWLAWAFKPTTWLLASFAVTGIARLVAFAVGHDAVGEPLVWIGLRLADLRRRPLAALGRRFRFGPARPDLLLHERGCDLVVVSCRPKPDWNERVTIALGTRFYRVLRSEERPDRGYRGFAYLLQESDSTEVIRGLVRYEPG